MTVEDKVRELIDLIEAMLDKPMDPQDREELDKLRVETLSLVNPEASGWGVWEYELQTQHVTNRPPLHHHVVRVPHATDEDLGLEVIFWMGREDGKPVIQIDGRGDFRINVNDNPIWDRSTEAE
ncbi:hypothetical protein SEA_DANIELLEIGNACE_74 [Arthrobacter phage DanielleIgnace]|nr:hypothetical protein SEA_DANIELLEIGNACE_74 [Arthrobacter phage DanielleIgnace]